MTALLDDFPTLTGRQEPHHQWGMPADLGSSSRGDAAVTLAERVRGGQTRFPWQANELREWLRVDPVTGRWLHSTCVLICPRQNGKTDVLFDRALYGAFVLGENIIFSVQRWKTGKKVAQRFVQLINKRPSLRSRLAKPPTMSAGQAEVVLKSGASIAFITRSPDSGTGFDDIDLIIYDESYNLTEGDRSALDPTQLAATNPQRIYASSAVNADIHANGYVLTGLREQGLSESARNFRFAEWMAPEDMDRDDEATWQYANPSYGVIQTAQKVRDLLQGAKTAAAKLVFDVNILGRGKWPALVETHQSMYSDEVLDQMAVGADTAVLTGPVVLAIDRSYQREWAISAAQHTVDGRVAAELGWRGKATNAEVAAKIVRLADEWDPAAVIIDERSAAAKVLIPLLLAEGIEPETSRTPDMAVACKGFEDDLIDGQLLNTGQPAVLESITGATKRVMPQGDWAWDRVKGGSGIAVLVSLTLARWGLLRFGPLVGDGALPEAPEAMPDSFDDDMHMDLDDDFDALTAGF